MKSGSSDPKPVHHGPSGFFRNPWKQHQPTIRDLIRFGRSMRRVVEPLGRQQLPSALPNPQYPRADAQRLSVTWVGHSTNLVQIGGHNVLTDPMWSARASPLRMLGPRRFMAPGLPIEALPPVDVVVLSHDHYDHADRDSIRRLQHRFPNAIWCAPLGVTKMLRRFGVTFVRELDWWAACVIDGLHVTCVPAQHFSGRRLRRNRTLWGGFVLRARDRAVYFVGDTGWFPEFCKTTQQCGPFDVILMPIGAYEPRWFMRTVHLNPDEAVRAYRALTGGTTADHATVMVANHWGTFKLTLEPLDEPPKLLQSAWSAQNLPSDRLWILAHGETRWLPS